MIGVLQARKGVRLQGAVVDMNLAGIGNPFVIFQLSNFAAQIGTKTFRIKRIQGLNEAGADSIIHICAGVVDWLPPLLTFNGLPFDFVEDELPEVEWAVDMQCWTVVANVTIQVEVEEIG